jgi:transcriptional regulator with XRE-family HTH domain
VPGERPEEFIVRVTRRIAEVRRARGITQDRFAEIMGIGTRRVQLIEAGQNLTLHTLSRVASALGVLPAELVGGEPIVPVAYENRKARPAALLNEARKALGTRGGGLAESQGGSGKEKGMKSPGGPKGRGTRRIGKAKTRRRIG